MFIVDKTASDREVLILIVTFRWDYHMMHSIHLLAKKKLYAPCIRKTALDGWVYQWTYTECDFHQELIFTSDCTKKLLEQGMQWSLSYVKSALHTENRASFFAHQSLKEQNTPFKQLPWELIDTMILRHEANSDEQFNHLTPDDMRDTIALAKNRC